MNQFSQYGFVAARLVRHVHGFKGSDGFGSSSSNEGTEAQADVEFRIERERVLGENEVSRCSKEKRSDKRRTYCHSIPEAIEGKFDGRVDKYVSMLWRASIADPTFDISYIC